MTLYDSRALVVQLASMVAHKSNGGGTSPPYPTLSIFINHILKEETKDKKGTRQLKQMLAAQLARMLSL